MSTTEIEVVEADTSLPETSRVRRHLLTPLIGSLSRVRSRLGGQEATRQLVYFGVALATLGFALIAVTWGQVAGEGEVWKQLPYIVSGGLTSIGLIIVGVALISMAMRYQRDRKRETQIERLVDAVERLETALNARDNAEPTRQRRTHPSNRRRTRARPTQ